MTKKSDTGIGPAVALSLLMTLFGCSVILSGQWLPERMMEIAYGAKVMFQKPIPAGKSVIVVGEGRFEKRVHATDIRLGRITHIRPMELRPEGETLLAAASPEYAVFFDSDRCPVRAVELNPDYTRVEIVDFGGGTHAFMDRGSWHRTSSLTDHEGSKVWKVRRSPGVNDMCAGDLDGDGKPEFAVGFNGGGGVRLIDGDGRLIWRKEGSNVWQVGIVDVTGEGDIRVVHSSSCGHLTIRDLDGNKSDHVRYDTRISDFSLCPWPTADDRSLILHANEGRIRLVDFDGSEALVSESFGTMQSAEVRGVPVKLGADRLSYLAAVLKLPGREGAAFIVLDTEGGIVYQEDFDEPCEAIRARPDPRGTGDEILVGGTGRIYAYRAVEGRNFGLVTAKADRSPEK